MTKFLLITLLSLISSLVFADDLWPTKIAAVGCKFEYKRIYSNESETLEIIEKLPFPKMQIERGWDRNKGQVSMAELLANAAGNEFDKSKQKRGSNRNLFIYGYMDKNGLSDLFPLFVGKRLGWSEFLSINTLLSKGKIEVLKRRKSPYFKDTDEHLIQFSIQYTHFESLAQYDTPHSYRPMYRLWWNTELGFYTEDEVILHDMSKKLHSTNCPPDNS